MIQAARCDAGVTPCRGTVAAGGVRLSYLEWGSTGAPLLLLHGITSDAQAWWRIAPVLLEAGYHVFALDMPGHGMSAPTETHTIPDIAALAGAALAALTTEPSVIIGHSWGGATAIVLASDPPAGIPPLKQVVLIDPAVRMNPDYGSERLMLYLDGLGGAVEVLEPVLRERNPDWHACDVYWKARALAACHKQAVRGFFVQSGTWDITPLLAKIRVPVLLLVADPRHTVIPPELLFAAQGAALPLGSQIVTMFGTDHSIQRGGFKLFMPTVSAWLHTINTLSTFQGG
ncbi:MAG: alpha/beta hydrolase [Chloroflexaceae bacterium]|nr:alpha/beta hydrolase [Chloroflexaceae bacterium]